MSTKYLGEQFYIHGGGMDLKFPLQMQKLLKEKVATVCFASEILDARKYADHERTRMIKSTGNYVCNFPHQLISGENDF